MQPNDHNQNSTNGIISGFEYISQASLILNAVDLWLERSEDEKLAEIFVALDRLNSLLPKSLKISLKKYSYDPEVDESYDEIGLGDLVIGLGIQIIVPERLKSQLISISTKVAIVTLVQIAIKIIETSSKGNVGYRDSLRKELLEFTETNRTIFGGEKAT